MKGNKYFLTSIANIISVEVLKNPRKSQHFSRVLGNIIIHLYITEALFGKRLSGKPLMIFHSKVLKKNSAN